MSSISQYKIVYIFLVIILSYWSIKPLLSQGFFPMHDDIQPSRVQQMAKSLLSFQFPVRWVPDLGYGYGYPLFNFYAPLPYYIGAIFHLFGFDVISATKGMFIIGVLISGLFMYLFISYIAGNMAGITSSMLYLYAPYHAVNIFVRGAVGEFYAYGFLPLVVLGIIKKDILIGSLGLAGVLLSHNILGMITIYFLVSLFLVLLVYRLIKRLRLSFIFYLLSFIALGIGLSSFFTLPAIFEKGYTRVDEITRGGGDFRNHFVFLDQLWQSEWGYAGSAPGRADGMSFKIGKLHVILGIFSFMLLVYLSRNKRIKREVFIFYLIIFTGFILSTFLTLDWSRFLWEVIPFFSYIQYPWRFLNLIVLFLSTLSSVIFFLIPKKLNLFLGIFFLVTVIFLNSKYFQPKFISHASEADYTSYDSLINQISKISDEYLPKDFKTPPVKSEMAFLVRTFEDKPTQKVFLMETPDESQQVFNITYFPGWQVFIDGRKTEVESQEGRIKIKIPPGMHLVSLKLNNTGVRKSANTISLLSVILLVYVSLFLRRRTLWQVKNKV